MIEIVALAAGIIAGLLTSLIAENRLHFQFSPKFRIGRGPLQGMGYRGGMTLVLLVALPVAVPLLLQSTFGIKGLEPVTRHLGYTLALMFLLAWGATQLILGRIILPAISELMRKSRK